MTKEAKDLAPPTEPEAKPAPKTLTEYVDEIHGIVLKAKGHGVSPVQILLGVGGRLSLGMWDFAVATLESGSKAPGK